MQLNNFLQVNGGTHRLQYVDIVSGPEDTATWTSTAYSKFAVLSCSLCLDFLLVDGIPYSNGHGETRGAAREEAAYNCYTVMRDL